MVSRKLLAAAVVLPLALAGCASGGSDPEGPTELEGTFTVYASLAVTGPLAGIAGANVAGLEAAAAAINAAGGIDGREVQIVVGDDGADPTKAATLLQEQLDSTEIDLVVAGNTSNVGLALTPILSREEIISTGQQAAINDPEAYPYHFSFVVPTKTQTQGMLEKVEAEGYEKVALLAANDANGTAITDTYRALFEDAGIDFVAESFAPTDVDMTAQLQRLQAEDPDVLILSGLGAVAGYELQSRTKLGWDIPTLGHTDMGTTDLAAVSTEADWTNVELLTFHVMDTTSARTAGFDELRTALEDAGVTLDQSFSQYAVMWDLLWVAKHVWESVDSDDPADIKDAYESLDIRADADSPYTFVPVIAYTADFHQLVIEPKDGITFIKPGPYVDGLIDQG